MYSVWEAASLHNSPKLNVAYILQLFC